MKVLVCGGRSFGNYKLVEEVLNKLNTVSGIDIIITGGCTGADALAQEWASDYRIHTAVVSALWREYGRQAGPLRNAAMLLLKPDMCVAFTGGRGTDGMVSLAKQNSIPVLDVRGEGK